MTIYERPTKSLMRDWAKKYIRPDQTFSKDDAVRWFMQHFPKIKSATVSMHVEVMSVNNQLRKHYPSIKPGSGHDLFYKLGPDQFRLWKQDTDPRPCYKQASVKKASDEHGRTDDDRFESNVETPKAANSTSISHGGRDGRRLFEAPYGAAKILELAKQSSDGLVTYGELWRCFRPNSPWSGHGSQQIVAQSLFDVIRYCVRQRLPIITVLVVRGTTRRLSAEAVKNIYEECRELGIDTGPSPEAFISDQIRRAKALDLHDLPDQRSLD